MPLATLAQTSRDTSLAPAPILTPLPGRLWTFLNSSNSIFLHIYSLVADPSKTCRKQSRNGRFMRDIAQEHNGTRTQSLSTRRKIISSVRPRHISKRRGPRQCIPLKTRYLGQFHFIFDDQRCSALTTMLSNHVDTTVTLNIAVFYSDTQVAFEIQHSRF